jgi:hypothetical protein
MACRNSKFLCFLERHANEFTRRLNMLNNRYTSFCFAIYFFLCSTFLIHMIWFRSAAGVEAAAAFYFFQTIVLLITNHICVEAFNDSWYNSRDNMKLYQENMNLLKANKDISQADLNKVLITCQSLLIDTVPSCEKDRMIAKFLKWSNKLKKC